MSINASLLSVNRIRTNVSRCREVLVCRGVKVWKINQWKTKKRWSAGCHSSDSERDWCCCCCYCCLSCTNAPALFRNKEMERKKRRRKEEKKKKEKEADVDSWPGSDGKLICHSGCMEVCSEVGKYIIHPLSGREERTKLVVRCQPKTRRGRIWMGGWM